MVQRLNGWSDSIAGGLEVFVNHLNTIDGVHDAIGDILDYDLKCNHHTRKLYTSI